MGASTYNEHITIDKQLSLIGENKDTTILSGNNEGNSVVMITSDWVNVTGFSVRNSGISYSDTIAGIHIYYVQHCTIQNNDASHNDYGIFLDNSNNNYIIGNTASNNVGDGICIG